MSARPVASLSSGLLARPGTAKPAMRPPVFGYGNVEDLGWNDMGNAAQPAAPVAAQPTPIQPTTVQSPAAEAVPVPPVLEARAELTRAVEAKGEAAAAAELAPKAPKPVTQSTTQGVHKAAFTLRLDPNRHLRLRLASAVAGRSSQHILVEALDAFLNTQPQVETLARQLPASGNPHRFSGEK